MRPVVRLSLQLAAAFALGIAAAPWLSNSFPRAQAETAGLAPMVIDLAALKEADLPATPNPDLRAKTFVTTDNATLGVQVGNVGKHFHARSDEIQYIVEGSGSAWLGDRQIDIRPGMLIVIPKGTNHAGTEATTGRFKAIAIKIPPQQAGDTTFVK